VALDGPDGLHYQWNSQDLVVVGALEGWSMEMGVLSPRGGDLGLCPLPYPENI